MKYKNAALILGLLYTFGIMNLLGMFSLVKEKPAAAAAPKETVSEAVTTERPQIAITFDDGPHPNGTPKLLEGLKERNVKATFFLIGMYAEKYPQLVKEIDKEGHLIGNHTFHHVSLTNISDGEGRKELKETAECIYKITGKSTEYVRAPFGTWNERLEGELNVIQVKWTVDPLDWTTENVDEIVDRVVTKVKEGDIILLHDCYGSSVEAALRIIDLLQAQGYQFVTVDELILV